MQSLSFVCGGGELVPCKSGKRTGLVSFIRSLNRLYPPGFESVVDDPIIDRACILYTFDAADDLLCVDVGAGRLFYK